MVTVARSQKDHSPTDRHLKQDAADFKQFAAFRHKEYKDQDNLAPTPGDSDDVDQSFRSHADQIGAKRRRALSV